MSREKTCDLHLIIPFGNRKYDDHKGHQYRGLFNWFDDWNVMNIARSIDKKWQLIWHTKMKGEQLCHHLCKGYHVRHRNGTRLSRLPKYVGYFIMQRCGDELVSKSQN